MHVSRFSQNFILSYWRPVLWLELLRGKFWLNKSLGVWFVTLLVHQEIMMFFIVFLLLLKVYSMLLFQLVLMLDELILLIEMFLILSLKHSFVFHLFLLNQLLLFLKVFGLSGILVMSNMS